MIYFCLLIISLLIVLVLSRCISCDIEGDHLSQKKKTKNKNNTTKGQQLKTTLRVWWAFCFVLCLEMPMSQHPCSIGCCFLEEQRDVHLWSLQQSLQFCFHHSVKSVLRKKCELVQIILEKPENNSNHLTAFKNKAVLLQKEFYWVKVGSEVIYRNFLEILQGDFTQGTARWCTKGFLFNFLIFSRFSFF